MNYAEWIESNQIEVRGDKQVFRVEPDYVVLFSAAEDYVILHAGAKLGTPAAKFSHPNLVASKSHLLEFKHYHSNGRKSWTAHPGVEFYWVLPKCKLELIREKGYSYVPVSVDGLRFRLNVSGGTGSPGWADWVGRVADTSCGFTIKQLNKLVGAGLTVQECKDRGITLDVSRESGSRFAALAAAKNHLAPGQVVHLEQGYNFGGSTGPFTVVRYEGKRKHYLVNVGGMNGKCPFRAIDWVKTATANSLPIVEHFAWTHLGIVREEAA